MNEIQEKLGDADSNQIKAMLISLMHKTIHNWSFDQVLYDCVTNPNENS